MRYKPIFVFLEYPMNNVFLMNIYFLSKIQIIKIIKSAALRDVYRVCSDAYIRVTRNLQFFFL